MSSPQHGTTHTSEREAFAGDHISAKERLAETTRELQDFLQEIDEVRADCARISTRFTDLGRSLGEIMLLLVIDEMSQAELERRIAVATEELLSGNFLTSGEAIADLLHMLVRGSDAQILRACAKVREISELVDDHKLRSAAEVLDGKLICAQRRYRDLYPKYEALLPRVSERCREVIKLQQMKRELLLKLDQADARREMMIDRLLACLPPGEPIIILADATISGLAEADLQRIDLVLNEMSHGFTSDERRAVWFEQRLSKHAYEIASIEIAIDTLRP